MAAAKTHDFEIRATVIRELLQHGIPRRDIRHEITLDSNSIGGRADIVVTLGDRLAGIEIKSAVDNLARCVEQLDAYARAFDVPLFVVDDRLARRLERPGREHVRGRAVMPTANLWERRAADHRSTATVASMTRLLWGSEIEALLGRPSARAAGLDWIRQNFGLDDLRPGVMAALRNRVPNKWETAFWARFDAEAAVKAA